MLKVKIDLLLRYIYIGKIDKVTFGEVKKLNF